MFYFYTVGFNSTFNGVGVLRTFVEELRGALGASKVVVDPAIVSLYSREPTGLSSEAMTVVFPENAGDVSRILSLAYKHGVPVYPQGSTTDLSGGALPEGGVVVSFERMRGCWVLVSLIPLLTLRLV